MPQKPEISADMMGNLDRMRILPTLALINAAKILTSNFHSFLDVLEAVNYLQKVQNTTGIFLRQWNLVGCGFFKLWFEHSLEHWRVHTQYQTMNMKLLILHHKNYVTIFPGFRKAMLHLLFWLVSSYRRKGVGKISQMEDSACVSVIPNLFSSFVILKRKQRKKIN